MKETIIFLSGALFGAVIAVGSILIVSEKHREIIFGKQEKSPDEESEKTSEKQEEKIEYTVIQDGALERASEAFRKLATTMYGAKEDATNYNKCYKLEEVGLEEPEEDILPEEEVPNGIYTITPDDFGEVDGYSMITLTYYSDGVITDRSDVRIEDVEELIGDFDKSMIGEYEQDAAYVRNDYRMEDYEILYDQRKYSDILKEKPYLFDHQEENDEN